MPGKNVVAVCVVASFLFAGLSGFAQTEPDSIPPVADSIQNVPASGADQIRIAVPAKRHDPRKATLLSAAFPGLGQVYNREYWKLPIIYGGIGTLAYFTIDNSQKYILWRDRYIAQRLALENGLSGDALPVQFPNGRGFIPLENLKRGKDQYRRWRDLNIVIAGLAYVLIIADANVFAHLKGFQLSEDLTVSVSPGMIDTGGAMPGAGLSLSFRFK
jgi:hypothetical protein